MKKRKILLCAILVSFAAANISLANDLNTTEAVKKTVNTQEIILEPPTQESNILKSIWNTLETRSEAARKAEEEANQESSDETDKVEASSDNIVPVYDLKGGVTKSPEKQTITSYYTNWTSGDYATGNWFGARDKLEDHGITLNSNLWFSGFGKTAGGMDNARAYRGYSLYNLSVTMDTAKMGLWKGGTMFMLYQRKARNGISTEFLGDYQNVDGYDWREMNQLSEVWYQQKLYKDKIRLKFGKQDGNTDFCALYKAWDFMNTSFLIMPTAPIPTYPDPAFGLMAGVSPKDWVEFKNGTYHKDGSAFNVSEIELKPTIKGLPGRYITGAWFYSTQIEAISGMDVDGNAITRNFYKNRGWYAAFEQMVYKEKKANKDGSQGLTLIGQVGLTPSNRNDVNRYFGAALHYKGLIPKRDNDITGVGMAMANFSTRLVDIDGRYGQETSLEVFHKIQVTPWFYLQPDVQFIMNPGGASPNSVALGLRSVINF